MEQTTLEVTRRERLGAWFYTGPAGRLVSFSIDLGLSIVALAIWATRRIGRRVRRGRACPGRGVLLGRSKTKLGADRRRSR
jgi:hypothetical protein